MSLTAWWDRNQHEGSRIALRIGRRPDVLAATDERLALIVERWNRDALELLRRAQRVEPEGHAA